MGEGHILSHCFTDLLRVESGFQRVESRPHEEQPSQ